MRFVILCFPRTASTLLINAIGQHPGVRHGLEIFNPVLEGDADFVRWRKALFKELIGDEAAPLTQSGYLDTVKIDAVEIMRRFNIEFHGTKIMYDQLPATAPVWSALSETKELKIIELWRNPIEAAVSFKVALETNVWHNTLGEARIPPRSITFEPGYFAWFYDHFCANAAKIRQYFNVQDILHVTYPALIENWDATLASIDDHLGMPRINHSKVFAKTIEGRTCGLVANVKEIREACLAHFALNRYVLDAFGASK